MAKDKKNEKKTCQGKKGLMLAYGTIQIGARVLSALSLITIAISFYSIKNESKVFTSCVEEIRGTGKNTAEAVHFCNGGN